MSHIYIALVDTPGFFAALIRRYVKQRYIHVVISEEPTFKEAYSVGRRNPAIPIFAGFTKESRNEILHTFPSAFYRICELDCTYAQKKAIMERLKKDYNKRMRIHYAVIGLPFILMGVPFYIKNQYTCSSYIGKILQENGIRVSSKHFSLITPKDFYECEKLRVLFEGRLSEISTKTSGCKIKECPFMSKKMIHRLILNSIFFIVIMLFTFDIVFQGQSFREIVNAIRQMPCQYIFTAIFLALLFVSAEGVMIWYLLKGIGEQAALPCCIAYSFIGFFFSGITPSATGGQPVQMYYMKRNGNSLSASSVVLMTIAISYKLVLVLIGIGMWIFWNIPLKRYLRGYYWLYFLGLFLNIVVVIILILVMFSSKLIRGCFCKLENVLVHLRLWKKDNSRIEKIDKFLSNYRNVVYFLKNHKKMIITTIVGTFIQRLSIFVLTYIVYCGLGFRTAGMADVILLQAAIYVAVDMLPIPGAQGVTEAMYKNVFRNIFSGKTLLASMCIIRGIGFYFLLLIGFVVFCIAGRTSIKKCHERNL